MSGSGGNGKDKLATDEVVGAGESASAEAEPSTQSGLQELPPTREQLDALRRERDDLKDALLRRRADLENFKRRAEREREAAASEAAAAVLRRLVETVDNLQRALGAEGGAEALRAGVELTLRDFKAALAALGVTALDPLGGRFDPERHQALVHEPVPGHAPGTVAEVFRSGYLYKERLLRPALVKVASGPPEEGDGSIDAGGGGEVQ